MSLELLFYACYDGSNAKKKHTKKTLVWMAVVEGIVATVAFLLIFISSFASYYYCSANCDNSCDWSVDYGDSSSYQCSTCELLTEEGYDYYSEEYYYYYECA